MNKMVLEFDGLLYVTINCQGGPTRIFNVGTIITIYLHVISKWHVGVGLKKLNNF